MRSFSGGRSFTEVRAESFIPGDEQLREMRLDIATYGSFPVFSEGHLYPRLGKEDARFVLAIGEEYQRLIEVLGDDRVERLLKLRPVATSAQIMDAIEPTCGAEVFHGPGHQSRAYCEVRGPHDEHDDHSGLTWEYGERFI